MTKILSLQAEEREITGKGASRLARRNGKLPATIYGNNRENVNLLLDYKSMMIHYHQPGYMSHLYEIHLGKHKFRVLPKEVQLHPVTDVIIHLDFIHVSEHSKLNVTVPIRINNKATCVGVKKGGELIVSKYDLHIICDPANIPEYIDIDVADLEIASTIHVKDIKSSGKFEIAEDQDLTIVAVVGRTAVAEEQKSAPQEAAKATK